MLRQFEMIRWCSRVHKVEMFQAHKKAVLEAKRDIAVTVEKVKGT
jgi:hypothetical protein